MIDDILIVLDIAINTVIAWIGYDDKQNWKKENEDIKVFLYILKFVKFCKNLV